jgi:hypothetical protein
MKQTFFTVIAISVLTFVSACTPKSAAIMTVEVTVYEEDVVRSESQKVKKIEYYPISGVYLDGYYKSNPAVGRDGKVTSAIWAIPRSDYIHPLYGLNGEMLTNDWPDADHPHHRGIFWAWLEVEGAWSNSSVRTISDISLPSALSL